MPDITAQTPDGTSHVFPDGTPDEVIDKVMKQHMQSIPSPEATAAANPPNPISKESNIITKGPEAQGQDLMANLSGHSKYPGSEGEAQKQLRQTTAGYAGAVAPMYVPGPGKGTLLMQAGKGALIGAGIGAGERAVTRAGQGQLPDLEGTAKAAGTGAAIGAVISPLSEIPSVGKYMRSTRLGKWLMPEAEAPLYETMGKSAQYRDMGRDAMKDYRQTYPAPESPANRSAGASTGIYRSRMGRTWNAGDLTQMPREQLAGEYAKEVAKPVSARDQEWMTALKAESERNTKGMYPGAAASTRGGAR